MDHSASNRIAVDIGGTFTDTVLVGADGRVAATAKTPTTPADPAEGALAGVRDVLARAGIGIGAVSSFIHGTTLATNALIERRGATVACITNDGFRDILEIGYERRYSQYDIDLEKPDLIVPRSRCFTIGGRLSAAGKELAPLDDRAIGRLADQLRGCGAQVAAICLLHSYANPAHEQRLRDLLHDRMPDLAIALSSEISPEAREFDRLCTTVANAYVQPLMARYLSRFAQRFAAEGLTCPILMMTAGGGMTTLETAARLPIRLVESGPAGGAILAARVARGLGERSVLSFDMGGTTAKLCLIDGFRPQHARTFEIGRAERLVKGSGLSARIPVIEMIEIGAGGGSIARVDRLGRLHVGPTSAGSEPGPAAFGRGGQDATVTDADTALGLIDPDRFAEGRLAIDIGKAAAALCRHVGHPLGLDAVDAAAGISEIVDESMASAARMHAVESGKDLGQRTMIAFGGNGPLHATRMARRAGVGRIVVPPDPGVGSAVGFLDAPVSFEIVRSRHGTLDKLDITGLNAFLRAMAAQAADVVEAGAPGARMTQRRAAFMRYHGQGHEIEIVLPARDLEPDDIDRFRSDFEAEYARQFSRAVPGMTIEILNWAVTVSTDAAPTPEPARCRRTRTAQPFGTRTIVCDISGKPVQAPQFDRAQLAPGDHLAGPALVVEAQTTTLISADFEAVVDSAFNLVLQRREAAP